SLFAARVAVRGANRGARATPYNDCHTKRGKFMKTRGVLLSILVLAVAVPGLYARGKKAAPTAPGTYKEWGPDIDQIEIVKTFKMSDYDKLVVQPFDTSKAPLPGKNANGYGQLKTALASYTAS